MEKNNDNKNTDLTKSDIKKLMEIDYTYPSPLDENFIKNIYAKREFYINKIPGRSELKTYEDVKDYRDKVCTRKFALHEQQSFLSNFINPDTPYRGALIFHGTGSGKCQKKDTCCLINGILMNSENIWNTYKKDILVDKEGGEWSIPSEELIVNSINSQGKIIKKKVSKLYREKINSKIREIKLENGYKIGITKVHKLLKNSGWDNDLKVGDFITIPSKLHNCPEKNKLNVTPELAFMMGWQISEGYEKLDVGTYYTEITNNDTILLQKLKDNLETLSKDYEIIFNNPSLRKDIHNDNKAWRLKINSKSYVTFLQNNGYVFGKRSREKKFPDFIMNSTIDNLKIFIQAYFDAEAYMCEKKGEIEIASASEIIMKQLGVLCKLFGINMRTKTKQKMATNGKRIMRDYYIGYIAGHNLRLFKEHIGFTVDYKQDGLVKACQRTVNTNVEVYPITHKLKAIHDHTNLPKRRFIEFNYIRQDNEGKTRLPSIDMVKKTCTNLKNVIQDGAFLKKNNLEDKVDYIQNSITELEFEANKEVHYVRIESVTEIDYNDYVYDLEVEDEHNYVAEGLLCHNTCASIAIAEKFKGMIQRYGTKIYVLVPGPLIKENWKNELLKCTNETYIKKYDTSTYISDADKNKMIKNAINATAQYYRLMSYRSFYKKVLGERITEKVTMDTDTTGKAKAVYRKTQEGEFERDIAIDRIYNLNNSVIIIDEAHSLTGNAYGEALMKVIKNSVNLRVILLTATPMKNLADDIVELLNFLRPPEAPIERDKIFTSNKNHLMELKPGGLEYLKKMATGYMSHLRGADPLTFAKRVEMGNIPKGLLFTNIVQCKMLQFQHDAYKEAIRNKDDALDRKSEAVANFAFPVLSVDKKSIVGAYGRDGINIIKSQLKSHRDLLNKKIATELFKIDDVSQMDGEFIYMSENDKSIAGLILDMKYLKYFSIKFYNTLQNLFKLFWGGKGSKTAFVYSNLVKVGIELFQQILLQNGFLEYDENPNNYKIISSTRCYYCGQTYKEHQQKKIQQVADMDDSKDAKSSSKSNKSAKSTEIPEHKFGPAIFISVTGKSSEESMESIPEDKQQILTNVFNDIENREGKFIKFVLGSKVMNEGISLKNVAEVHILDVYFNLGKVDQVIGRAIRQCSHYNVIDDNNRYPTVEVYKYAVSLDGELSSEEELYKKAELKYLLIKKVERAIKTIAIDCPLNRNGNIFPEELEEFKDCVEPGEPNKNNKPLCPSRCDFTGCDFKCDSKILNHYWDEKTHTYKKLSKNELDYSTFTQMLAKAEIESVKNKIKDLYRIKYVYTLDKIVSTIREMYSGEKKELFDDYFCFKALDELIPSTENDFNNFKDTIFDKFNRPGYLIFVNKYYIFQPFDQNEDVLMYYRTTDDKYICKPLTLYNYLKNTDKFQKIKGISKNKKSIDSKKIVAYDFNSIMDYYDNRKEFDFVGIIDKESIKQKDRDNDELKSVFKIRDKRPKLIKKQRETDLPSLKGAVCTTKDKDYINKVAQALNIKTDKTTRSDLCKLIRDELLHREKHSGGKNKMTYMMIPKNHEEYPFPYNLEDRVEYIIEQIKENIKFKINIAIKETTVKKLIEHQIIVSYTDKQELAKFAKLFESLGGVNKNGSFEFILK